MLILFFIRRYLTSYLLIMVLGVGAFVGFTMLVDGLFLVVLGWFALILLALGAVPWLIIKDVQMLRAEVQEHVHLIKAYKYSGGDAAVYQEKVVSLVAKRTGMPKRLVNQAVCRALNL